MRTEATRLLLGLAERSPDAMVLCDAHGGVVYSNPVAARLTGWPSEQAAGRPVDEVLLLSAAPRADRVDAARLLAGLERQSFVLRSRDGKEHRVEAYSCRLEAEEAAAVVMLRDLGPAGAYQVTDHFLGVLSHALRTPLNAMAGWLYVLKSGSNLPEAMSRKALEGIGRAVEQQQRFLDDMRDMAHILTGNLKVELHAIDVRPAVEAALQEIIPQANTKGVNVRHERGAGHLRAIADAARLQQALRHLLVNALKHTPSAGEIIVSAEEAGEHVDIRVSDDGEPIPPAVLPFVFDRFGQGDATASRGDDGFGLGLVKKLIELQSGHVMARSSGASSGAHFVIRLQRPPSIQSANTPVTAAPRRQSSGNPTRDL